MWNQTLYKNEKLDWWVIVGPPVCEQLGLHHSYRAVSVKAQLTLWSWLSAVQGWRGCHHFWCGGISHHQIHWRRATIEERRRCQTGLVPEHSPASLCAWLDAKESRHPVDLFQEGKEAFPANQVKVKVKVNFINRFCWHQLTDYSMSNTTSNKPHIQITVHTSYC